MDVKQMNTTYIAFLRGINVGGHHKVPMADLKIALEKIGFSNIETLLNSGNVIFDAIPVNSSNLEAVLSEVLEKRFGFPIPTRIRTAKSIQKLVDREPFKEVNLTKDIRLYVSFLAKDTESKLILPWQSDDDSYKILGYEDKILWSVLDLSITNTPKAMEFAERFYGKDMTTRNWNTVLRIVKKLDSRS